MEVNSFNRMFPVGSLVYLTTPQGSKAATIRGSAIHHSSGKPQVWISGEEGSRPISDVDVQLSKARRFG